MRNHIVDMQTAPEVFLNLFQECWTAFHSLSLSDYIFYDPYWLNLMLYFSRNIWENWNK